MISRTACAGPGKWQGSVRRFAAWRLLLHDRSTTAGSVLGVVAIIFLVGQQLAVLFGLFSLMSALVDHSGADIWVVTRDTRDVNSTGSLPVRYVDRLSGLPDIEWVEPLVSGGGSFKRADGKFQPVQIIGLARPRMAGGPWRFAAGGLNALFDYDGGTVDKLDLKVLGYPDLSQVVEVNGRRLRINALTRGIRGFSGTLLFTNEDKAREITGTPRTRCSNILVKVKPGRSIAGVIGQIRAILPEAEPIAAPELARNTRLFYVTDTGIGSSFGFSTLIGALVGVVIIMLTMYTTVLNHQRDYAVLRALGARRHDILVIVLFQSLFVGLIGILIGFLLMAGFLAGVRDTRLPAYMPLWLPPIHAAATLLLCVLGSLLAIRRANRIEPASAFR